MKHLMIQPMKTDLKKVFAISEHPGLYRFISDSKNGKIVESMTDKKRTCMSPRARIVPLAEIAVYTDEGELHLKEVLERIKGLPAECEVPDPKSDATILRKFFEEVIPNYDRDRFYASHMKKVLEWFRLLRNNDALDFEEEEEKEEEKGGEKGEELAPAVEA
jgi:hypothetical protein